MVKTKSGKGFWENPDKIMETVVMDKKIKEDFSKFAKENRINKSKLVESLYKAILSKAGLNLSQSYVTINLFSCQNPEKKLK